MLTREQMKKIRELLFVIQDIRRNAQGMYIPFELAASIERADLLQAECSEIVYSTDNTSPEQK